MNPEQQTWLIKEAAKLLGFNACGIATAIQLDDDARRLERWLSNGYNAGMDWMERYFDLRIDPRKLVPGARSVITVILHYFPKEQQVPDAPKIAKYAYGQDYHDVIRAKLNALLAIIKEKIGNVDGRGFVDSAPVLERAWAQKAGLGWVGKNGNLLTKNSGSFFFIATLITDLDLIADMPFATDHCGTCTRCIDACPTDAIVAPTVIDSNRCISYNTIELKDAMMPSEIAEKLTGWAFGCDICQDVCPWNRFAQMTDEASFNPIPEVLNLSKNEWQKMSEDAFRKIFKTSAIKRTKWKGMIRNVGNPH